MILIASPKVECDNPAEVLRTHPFIRFSSGAVVGTKVEKWLQDHDIAVHDTMELASLEAIYGMVLADLDVSIIPELCMKVANQPPLRCIRLAAEGDPVREPGLICRKDRIRRASSRRSRAPLCARCGSIPFRPKPSCRPSDMGIEFLAVLLDGAFAGGVINGAGGIRHLAVRAWLLAAGLARSAGRRHSGGDVRRHRFVGPVGRPR